MYICTYIHICTYIYRYTCVCTYVFSFVSFCMSQISTCWSLGLVLCAACAARAETWRERSILRFVLASPPNWFVSSPVM